MNADELIALNEQIAGMARAGLPLDQGLDSLAREMSRGRLRHVTQAIAADLRRRHPARSHRPPPKGTAAVLRQPHYCWRAPAGLPDVLATLTTYARTVAVTRTIVLDSLFYPLVVTVLRHRPAGPALVFFVLPQFDVIFNDSAIEVPADDRDRCFDHRPPPDSWILTRPLDLRYSGR